MANSVLLTHPLSVPPQYTKILQFRHPFSLRRLKPNPFQTSSPKSLTFYTKKSFVRVLKQEGTDASSPAPALLGEDSAEFLLSKQKISSWLYFSGILGVVLYLLNFAWIDNSTGFGKPFIDAVSSISDSPEVCPGLFFFILFLSISAKNLFTKSQTKIRK